MSPEKIAELKNRPIDLSDIPEVTSEQLKDFYSRNRNKDAFEFVIYMIHVCAGKWSQLPSTVYKKLKDSDCIDKLLVPYYDIFKTQVSDFIVYDIEDYLAARGISING